MSPRPSRFSGFNARNIGLWALAAGLASVAVWLAPTPPARHVAAPVGELVFFEFADDAGLPLDAGVVDSSPTDAAP